MRLQNMVIEVQIDKKNFFLRKPNFKQMSFQKCLKLRQCVCSSDFSWD